MKNLIRNESAVAIFLRIRHLFLSPGTRRISSVKNGFLALAICFGACSSGMGQWLSEAKWETGIATGPMVFMGDLGGNPGVGKPLLKDYNIPSTRYTIGAYITCYPQPWLGVRFMINHGELYGSDALTNVKSGDELSRKNRNLDFKSQLNEGLLMAEFMPTIFLEDDPGQFIGKIRPYGLLGIGVFHFNPQGSYTDSLGNTSWQYLRPLHTEGEGFAEYPGRKMYSLTQITIPMGFGARYYMNDRFTVSAEVLHRKTFTHYIDDVSTTYIDPSLFYKYLPYAQAVIADKISNKSPMRNDPVSPYQPGDKRGDSNRDNAYFSFNFMVGIRIGPEPNPYDSGNHPRLRF
jgi:hypothetical protein